MQIDSSIGSWSFRRGGCACPRGKSHAGDPWGPTPLRRLPRGSVHTTTVQNVVDYGYFVDFDDGLTGSAHKSNYNGLRADPGDRVSVGIVRIDATQRRMSLKLLAVLAEDVGDHINGIQGAFEFNGK